MKAWDTGDWTQCHTFEISTVPSFMMFANPLSLGVLREWLHLPGENWEESSSQPGSFSNLDLVREWSWWELHWKSSCHLYRTFGGWAWAPWAQSETSLPQPAFVPKGTILMMMHSRKTSVSTVLFIPVGTAYMGSQMISRFLGKESRIPCEKNVLGYE